MRILVTTDIDIPHSRSARLCHLLNYFTTAGHAVHVIAPKANRAKINGKLEKSLCMHYVQKKNMLIGSKKNASAGLHEINNILKSINLKNIDVHLSYGSILINRLVRAALKKAKIKTVYDIDCQLLNKHDKTIEKAIADSIRHADAITSPCAIKIPGSGAEVIPNGIDFGIYRPKKSRGKCITIGYVKDDRSNILAILQALRKLDGYKFSLLFHRRFSDAIKKQKMKAEFTDRTDCPEDIARLDIAVVPGRSALPYMAMEKAVISPNKHASGSLYAKTRLEWEKQISLFYHDEVMRERIGKEARKYASEELNWKKTCVRFERLLKKHSRNQK